MNTQLTSDHDEGRDPPNLQPDDLTLAVPLGAVAEQTPSRAQSASNYYTWEDDHDKDADEEISSQLARPFQLSTGMPVLQAEQHVGSGQVSPPVEKKAPRGLSHFLRIAIIATLVVAAMGFLWMTVFAQPAQPLTTPRGTSVTARQTVSPSPSTIVIRRATPMAKQAPTSAPTIVKGNTGGTSGSMQGENWVPQRLPAGWTAAGLTSGDAIFAERTAWTFTDREEALDFRNVGTRAQHGGTFTASTFLLSPGGKTRFFQNDIRVINDALFDHVQNVQLIQTAVNVMPSLVQFQTQGQNQFALIDVSYQLYQSQIDLRTQQRVDGLDMDPMTNQPRIHHMSVLLVRIAPGTQGQDAPMGGTGWLVSSYGLDMASLLVITQPI